MPRLGRSTLVTFAGLLIGIAGLVIQWIANPAKFAGAEDSFGIAFPPGIVFVLGAGLLTLVTARWWWHAVFAVLIGVWIVGVGSLANQLQPNLFSTNPGTVAGNVVMALGLTLGVVAGVTSMVSTRRRTRAARAVAA